VGDLSNAQGTLDKVSCYVAIQSHTPNGYKLDLYLWEKNTLTHRRRDTCSLGNVGIKQALGRNVGHALKNRDISVVRSLAMFLENISFT